MNINEFSNHRFLIIGGTTRAGTTSLYTYLADHPQICPSSLKETRFFLDADYPLLISTAKKKIDLSYSYNHGPYLAEAIEGVVAQETDFPN